MFTTLDLVNHFGFKVISGSLSSLKREIKVMELDRPGLELCGQFQYHQKDRIMLIGNKELAIIEGSSFDSIYKNALEICNPECPCIIITHSNPCPEAILKAAKEKDVPIFSSDADTTSLEADMYIYLSEALAPKTAIHACLLEIFGTGVILQGASGIGKSEISLDLIKRGHRLIADDRVNISAVRGKLIGSCPESIYGMMEVRGIGIIDVARMFGINSLEKKTIIKLLINLVPFDPNQPLERIGMKTDRLDILGESVPMLKLPVSAARSMAEIIEVAVTNFKLKDYGYDTGYEFQRRLSEIADRKIRERKEAEMILNKVDGDKNVISMNPEPDDDSSIKVGNINPESSQDDTNYKVRIVGKDKQ